MPSDAPRRPRPDAFPLRALPGAPPATRRATLAVTAAVLLATFGTILAPTAPVRAAEAAAIPRPSQLEPDVRFWTRIYSQVTTQGGLLHDDRFLDVVYEELRFPAGLAPAERRELVDAAREKYRAILAKLGTGARDDLSAEERRVLRLWPKGVTDAQLREAAERVRFQLGQADRFREGLVRAGAWEHHVEATLRQRGLPEELSALPHVESSWNPRAYSKVGAAGMWQFMPSTGRRWLRVDDVVDERLDPYKSTLAAAQYLELNHSILGTWPLALTAYNHGAGGMRRAKELMGTDDIVTIVRNYQSRTFGFASRNFYVSFLAAVEVDRNYRKYLGPIERDPRDDSRVVRLPDYVPIAALERIYATDRDTLKSLNLALMDPVLRGERFVPRGFELRVPAAAGEPGARLARLEPGERFDAQKRDAVHRVRRGETLATIARRHGTTQKEIMALNGLKSPRALRAGMTLKLPGTVPAVAAARPLAPGERPAKDLRAAAETARAKPQPVSREQAADESPALVPGVTAAALADSTDYGVVDGSTVVQGAETLGHFAEWLEVSPSRLRELNRMKPDTALELGRRIRLDLSQVDAATFESRRVAYHRQLQDAFFERWRITAQERYRIRPGESLWQLTQRTNVPVWLLRQYNPELDFANWRTGTELVLPRIEAVAATGGRVG